ncbi:energy-coupling factor transporter transmembrane protein EcfT [Promethearchaeum syntrophicum]|uniref:Energy-coupling factor transporter transmembrane protein EcfT n=1 Tax=Promethearchaeum syntrophicum TaxID=2594042 RepID=A0A5B9D5R2_9ARCH|nr:energy-coupling factor transporter transmembrane component T [Candidatus Prometheoarchaeum syntrophicum]QEE14459.1 Energy-coupling factor transporter transmembrane protein EcfT [Candidatus Prometheoarchaeum syntrophicum]
MSLEFAKTFSFLHKNTILHRLDPRSKLFMILTYTILAFMFRTLPLMIILFLLAILLMLIANLSSQFFKGVKGLYFVIFFILIINTNTSDGSFNKSLITIIRLLILMIIFSIYFQTTLPEDITQSLILLHIPYPTAFSLSLSFRFVPTMAQETEIVMNAQKSRGHRIQEGGMIQQIRNLFPLLIPLLMNSIRRAYHVAEALETRAFGVKKVPNFYYPLRLKLLDLCFIVLNAIILGVGIFIQINLDLIPILNWGLSI